MNETYHYCIADFRFSVSCILDLDNLLPSFSTFRTKSCCKEERLFVMDVLPRIPESMDDMVEMDVSDNDMGQVRLLGNPDSYCIELKYEDGMVHRMQADKSFTSIQVELCRQDR